MSFFSSYKSYFKNIMKTGGIYIHAPFCTEKCIYCDYYSLANHKDLIELFIKNLCKEIELTSKNVNIDWTIDTLFIGGGTPSLLTLSQIEKVIEEINKHFNLSNLKEFTIEANPGEFNSKKMHDFQLLGVNRISLGFQSLDNDILKFLSRWHSVKDCIDSYTNARKAGFNNINIDMLFGIPKQSLKEWKKNLDLIIELSPEHISAYPLTIERNTPLYNAVESGGIKAPHQKKTVAMYSHTMDLLNKGEFLQYETSSYSKKNNQCQHNLHYWRRDPYLAFGPSGHGYSNGNRYWNIKDLNKYIEVLNSDNLPIQKTEILNKENIFNEMILNGLKISDGINMNKIKKLFSNEIYYLLSNKIIEWGDCLIKEEESIRLSKKGYFIADEITLDFMNSYI